MIEIIEFIGDGEDKEEHCIPGCYHAEGILDFTLCGITLDGDVGTAGNYRVVKKRINCNGCIDLINYCASISKNQIGRSKF